MLIDTHAHLYLSQFENDRGEMMERAREKGVQKIFLPNIDSSSIEDMLELEAAYPGRCHAMMGLHPCSVKASYKEELALVRKWLDRRAFCAIGEIGLDLYWDKSFFKEQQKAFRTQINWAKELDIPIVIHSRNSTEEVLAIVREEKEDNLRGIFHCFGGSEEEAKAIIDLGFFLGIGGVLTYKKAGLDKVMETISLDYVVLETDSPYLAPVPFRGKRNESAYIHQIGAKLASVKNVSLEEVARKTSHNALKIFGMPD